jgi:hypothetical protein
MPPVYISSLSPSLFSLYYRIHAHGSPQLPYRNIAVLTEAVIDIVTGSMCRVGVEFGICAVVGVSVVEVVSAAALCPVTVAALARVGVVIVWTLGASVGAGVVAGVGARVCSSIGAALSAGIRSRIAGRWWDYWHYC